MPVFGASVIWGDVWKSTDRGKNWSKILDPKTSSDPNTPDHWPARAFFEAVTKDGQMYVLGGQDFNLIDNSDPNGPPLIPFSNFFNDVWKSSDDGVTWDPVKEAAPWEPRAGAAVVVKDDYIYLLGGEDGFTCDSGGSRCPPYFNDVWRFSFVPEPSTLLLAAIGVLGVVAVRNRRSSLRSR